MSSEISHAAGQTTRLHAFDADDGCEVWLDTDVGDHDGLCIGVGPTREEALRDAWDELVVCLTELRRAIDGGAA